VEVKKETEKQPYHEGKSTINQMDGKQLLLLSPIKETLTRLSPTDRKRERKILHSVSWKNLEKELQHPVKHTPPLMIRMGKFVVHFNM